MTRLARGTSRPFSFSHLGHLREVFYWQVNKKTEKAKHASTPLDLIHSDICGPFNVKAQNGCSYYITFVDNFSRYDHIYLISYKSEALGYFQRYLAKVENRRADV